MALQQPIIIFGIGRTGSTIFHRVLCEHPRISWLTGLADRWPQRPWVNRQLMRLVDVPGVGRLANRVYPSECYDFLEHHCPGFRRPCRDLLAADLSDRSAKRLNAALVEVPTDKRPRISLKITGWPRLTFLAKCFPEARFVHLIRDGRAVANSFLNVKWWEGWRGPSNWRWGPLPPAYAEEWDDHDQSFVALAGIQWKIYMDAVAQAKSQLADGTLQEIRFEDYCKSPADTFETVSEFLELEPSTAFQQRLQRFPVHDVASKWQRDLSAGQQETLEKVLASHLAPNGYV